jgi:uncharacterized protein GlcG (DUF336 family)
MEGRAMLKKLLLMISILMLSASNSIADSKTFVTYRSLTVETALELAKATLEACRKLDFQIAVAVVDRGGNTQVVLRDRYAGPHTGETARRKASTAVSFRTDTLELNKLSEAGKVASGIRSLPGVAAIGGGVMIQAAGSLVGGVGVSGAPGGTVDDQCAKKGLEKIQDKLDF